MNTETIVVAASFVVLVVAAALVFLVRSILALPGWTPARKAVFELIADYLKSVSSTLLGIALVGYILDQLEGQQFDFSVQGYKLVIAATALLVTGIFIASSVADDDGRI